MRKLLVAVPALLLAACAQPEAPAQEAKTDAVAKSDEKLGEVAKAHAEADAVAEDGCIHGGHKEGGECAPAAPAVGGEPGHYGAAFKGSEQVALASAISSMSEAEGATVQVKGEVTSVCQAKGCWMVIKDHDDEKVTARVLMKDHSFSVPMDGTGKKAVVEGTLTSRTFNAAQVKHLAKDAGDDPSKVEGTRTEYVLTASGVKLES